MSNTANRLRAICEDIRRTPYPLAVLIPLMQKAADELEQRKPLTNGELYTAYITATNQTLRPQDERLALAFARAIEAAHGIGDK